MDEAVKVREPSDGSPAERPSVPKKKTSKSRKPAVQKKPELHREFIVRMQRLRSVAKEISRTYLSNLERDVLEVVDDVNEKGGRGTRKKVLKPATLERMVDIVDQLSLKPEKGRRKDLKKIERALFEIMHLITKGKG